MTTFQPFKVLKKVRVKLAGAGTNIGDWKFLALATGKLHNTRVIVQVNALLSAFHGKSHHISIVLHLLRSPGAFSQNVGKIIF